MNPEIPEPPPVRVEEWAGRQVVVVIGGGDVPGDTPIWNRRALLAGLTWQARERGEAVREPFLAPIPPAALAAFDVPEIPKFNRAQARAAGQRGKRKK